jgi:hypothetical protein
METSLNRYLISAMRMMMGMGTPSSHKRIDRMIVSGSGRGEHGRIPQPPAKSCREAGCERAHEQ